MECSLIQIYHSWLFCFFFFDELHRFYQLLSPIFNCLVSFSEKAMATHPSTLAWKIPWTEAPGRLQSLGSLRARHDWATSLSLFTFMHWRRKWQPTPVFLPGEPRNGGTWWAAVYEVAQSQTRLKWLSSRSSICNGQVVLFVCLCSKRNRNEKEENDSIAMGSKRNYQTSITKSLLNLQLSWWRSSDKT